MTENITGGGNGNDYSLIRRGKRPASASDAFGDDVVETILHDWSGSDEDWLAHRFPDLYPASLQAQQRNIELGLQNPFAETVIRHQVLGKAPEGLPKDGAINGYLKFQIIHPGSEKGQKHQNQQMGRIGQSSTVHTHSRRQTTTPTRSNFEISRLPPDFGRNLNLNPMDSKLLRFYMIAFCNGRTVLPKTNLWLVDITPMAATSDCVKHALLALAAGYCLYFEPSESLQNRANFHYRRATDLLSRAIANPESQNIGKEDTTVASLLLLFVDDAVNYELRREKNLPPRWLEGAGIARQILDASDPGYRYWNPANVQSSDARISNANMVAYIDICAHPVTPLQPKDNDRTYTWLLEGTERDSRKIHGGTGLSPKLLHIFAQITYFSALASEDPDSPVLFQAAEKLEARLFNFRQWSELSEGYETSEELLASCQLDEMGKVYTAAQVTELTAETYVAAAQIYLSCRFFRRSRSHPYVQESLRTLLHCIDLMPTSGNLFTSQSPCFSIYIMCLVSYRHEDRRVARDWFGAVTAVGNRSCAPPVWTAIQKLWEWLDGGGIGFDDYWGSFADDQIPISQRPPWWEHVVEWLMENEGVLSLY